MNETKLSMLFGGSLISVGLFQGVLYGFYDVWIMAVIGFFQTVIGLLYLWAKGLLPIATTAE